MSKTSNSELTGNHIEMPDTGSWDESLNAMQSYLTLLKKHSEIKAKKAEEKIAENEAALETLKQKRRKRRNYGTRTGIVLQDGTDTGTQV